VRSSTEHRWSLRLGVYGALVAVLGGVIFGAASAAHADSPSGSVLAAQPADPAATLANSPLGDVPDRVASMGATQFPHVYGSFVVTDNGSHIDVYLTSDDPAAESHLVSLASPGTISFKHTGHTRDQLLALHASVTRQVPALADEGIRVVSWVPGINGDGLEHIGVLNLTAADTAVLNGLFGADNITLENVQPDALGVTSGRNSDSAPWNGGDNLTSSGEGCTSGAAINYNGARYMLTAAHCYQPGWSIYNAFGGQSGPYMGYEVSRDVSYGGDDTALLSMSSSDLIWTGIVGQPVRATDTGWATNPDADVVCNEGAYWGEVCSVVQNNYLGCKWVGPYSGLSGNRYECNLVLASRIDNRIANQAGDSGGPMIRYVGGNLKVTGVVSGSDSSTQVGCQYNTQYSDVCWSTVWYTAMDEILANEYPGASLYTG
jgi:hypothetical protein